MPHEFEYLPSLSMKSETVLPKGTLVILDTSERGVVESGHLAHIFLRITGDGAENAAIVMSFDNSGKEIITITQLNDLLSGPTSGSLVSGTWNLLRYDIVNDVFVLAYLGGPDSRGTPYENSVRVVVDNRHTGNIVVAMSRTVRWRRIV